MIPPCRKCGGDIDECNCPRIPSRAFREFNKTDDDESEFEDTFDFNFHDDD